MSAVAGRKACASASATTNPSFFTSLQQPECSMNMNPSTYGGSSLPSLRLQVKGFEYSLETRRRVPERKSPNKRQGVGVRNSSSGPCVLSLSIEPNRELLTRHFCSAAKVIHRWLRRSSQRLSSPANNFGGTISAQDQETDFTGPPDLGSRRCVVRKRSLEESQLLPPRP
jgi:hypothetical protein